MPWYTTSSVFFGRSSATSDLTLRSRYGSRTLCSSVAAIRGTTRFFWAFPFKVGGCMRLSASLKCFIRAEVWSSYREQADFVCWHMTRQSRPSHQPQRRGAEWSSVASRAPSGCSGWGSRSAELWSRLRTAITRQAQGRFLYNGPKYRGTEMF